MSIIDSLLESRTKRGWLSPIGEFFEIGGGVDHGDAAEEICRDNGWEARPDESGVVYYSDELLRRGWLRVVGGGVFSAHRLNGITAAEVAEWAERDAEDMMVVDFGYPRISGRVTSREVLEAIWDAGLA